MSTAVATAAQNQPAPIGKAPSFGLELKTKIPQFMAALPKHIPQERFARVIMTAVQLNPELLKCSRQSLWNAAMKAASDGLLPDGREGALVPYKGQVQWMPMIGGLRKKVRNSKELSDWNAQVVHAKDEFEYELGDDPFIKHKPYTGGGDPGPVIAAYSVATFRGTGDKSREVMTRAQLDKVRASSKSSKGPWYDWFEEMCRKTVARRHAKTLPMSTDMDDIIRRDDELYDLKGASDKVAGASGRLSLTGTLDALASMPDPDQVLAEVVDEETGEVTQTIEQRPATQEKNEAKPAAATTPAEVSSAAQPARADTISPEREAVLKKLRPKAAKGTDALRRGLGTISEADEKMLTEADHEELGAIADEADKAKGATG